MVRINFLLIISILVFVSCKNDMDKVNEITKSIIVPNLSMLDADIQYTDSGRIKLKVQAPELNKYDLDKEPYTEFPLGIKVVFFKSDGSIESQITANYAIYYQEKELWEARGNVIAINEKKEELNTEQLFWMQNEGKIYSEQFTKINTPDGTFIGDNGFESNQEFSRWRLKRSKGSVNVKENE